MKTIQLTQGFVALVDDEDFSETSKYEWSVNGRGYAQRNQQQPDGAWRPVLLHRELLGLGPKEQADHANGNRLDCRRSNIRRATNAQNNANRAKKPGCSSCFKGVSWYKQSGKWRACIKTGGRNRALGHFVREDHAAYAYDLAAVQTFGEFAFTNFPVPGSTRWLFGAVP